MPAHPRHSRFRRFVTRIEDSRLGDILGMLALATLLITTLYLTEVLQ